MLPLPASRQILFWMRASLVAPRLVWALALPLLVISPGLAQAEVAANGTASVGVGALGGRPVTSFDVGFDVSQGELELGLGGRLRFLLEGGLRTADWDEPSEGALVLRRVRYRHVGTATAYALAIGPLRDIALGHGAIVAGYTSGLDIDHGRSGVHARLSRGTTAFETLIDDVIQARILAARVVSGDRVRLGLTAALDREAPVPGAAVATGILGVDAEWPIPLDVVESALTLDAVGIPGVGAGVHVGANAKLVERAVTFKPFTTLHYGSDGYIPGWFSPLYELSRAYFGLEYAQPEETQRAVAASGGLGGLGARLGADLSWRGLGEMSFAYAIRRGARNLAMGRILMPWFSSVQAGGWFAVELADARSSESWSGAAAFELRVRLSTALFLAGELSRLYQEDAGYLRPITSASVAIGMTVGE